MCGGGWGWKQQLTVTLSAQFYSLSSFDSLEVCSMLLSYTRQVAMGMMSLALKSYVHRDLAARNILVSGDGMVCKVSISYVASKLTRAVHAGNPLHLDSNCDRFTKDR